MTTNPDPHVEADIEEEAPEVVEAEEVTTDDEPDPPSQPAHDPDVEAEARFLGWKPEAEWKGDKPPGFINDPQEFLNRWENVTPVKRLRERAEAKEREADERIRKIETVSEQAMERLKKQHEAQIAEIRQKRREAVESGDVDAYDRLEKQERALVESQEAPAAPEKPEPAPEVVAYREANDWAKDPVLWAEAVNLVNYMPNLGSSGPKEQLEFAEAQIKRRYPHMFQTEQPQRTTKVDGGGLGASKRSGFATLPAEAKQTFKRFVKEGLFEDNDKGRQEFFDDYERA